jgi:predicted unusual protein kinase regulating ubiquinone biosynthesis (AarF/ABC1/UbiB family)
MNRSQERLLTFATARLKHFRVKLGRLLSPDIDEDAERREAQLAEAEELTRRAAGLRGGVAKIGQLRAYLQGSGSVAPEAQKALSRLFDHVPGDEPQAIRRVIEEDLGAPPEKLFAEWADRPMAAASLGQVHAARAHDGSLLAVKVQYPGVAAALRDDLDSRGVLRELVGADLGGAVSDEAIATLRDRLLRELDYAEELRSLRRFRSAFSDEASVVIPRVVPERSSGRVLTMERLHGRSLPELAQTRPADERSAVAHTILRFALVGPIRHGLINADPNPGNYLVLKDEPAEPAASPLARVGFIDFGCVAELPEELRQADHDLWMAMIRRDGEALRHAAHRAGLIPAAKSFDAAVYRRWERQLSEPFLAREARPLLPEYVRELASLTWQLAHTQVLSLQPEALLLWRQRLGVFAVLASLAPTLPFRRVLGDVLDDRSHPVPLLQRFP